MHSPPPGTKFPLVIFSHGLAGTRTTYSQYCSALASEGYVVLSIEHKDGSGPLVTVPKGDGDGEKDGLLHYTRESDIVCVPERHADAGHH
jgi:platelet-activating factor acetylhydrolase